MADSPFYTLSKVVKRVPATLPDSTVDTRFRKNPQAMCDYCHTCPISDRRSGGWRSRAMANCLQSNWEYMHHAGLLNGTFLCFDCLVQVDLDEARAAGRPIDRDLACLDVVFRLSCGGGVGPSDVMTSRHEPIPHSRIAAQLAIAGANNRVPALSDYLVTPNDEEDPQCVGTTLPSCQTGDSRLASPFVVACDSCPRVFDGVLPTDTPPGAFIFACPDDRGVECHNGLPTHRDLQRAFRDGVWNARWECIYCLAITYSLPIDELVVILNAASDDLIPPLPAKSMGNAPAHPRPRGRFALRAAGRRTRSAGDGTPDASAGPRDHAGQRSRSPGNGAHAGRRLPVPRLRKARSCTPSRKADPVPRLEVFEFLDQALDDSAAARRAWEALVPPTHSGTPAPQDVGYAKTCAFLRRIAHPAALIPEGDADREADRWAAGEILADGPRPGPPPGLERPARGAAARRPTPDPVTAATAAKAFSDFLRTHRAHRTGNERLGNTEWTAFSSRNFYYNDPDRLDALQHALYCEHLARRGDAMLCFPSSARRLGQLAVALRASREADLATAPNPAAQSSASGGAAGPGAAAARPAPPHPPAGSDGHGPDPWGTWSRRHEAAPPGDRFDPTAPRAAPAPPPQIGQPPPAPGPIASLRKDALVRIIQYYRSLSPSHEASWNITRVGRPPLERQGDPNRWDIESLVAFLCDAYGHPAGPLTPEARLPDNLVPPTFDPEPGENIFRRRAAGLIRAMADSEPFHVFLKVNNIESSHDPARHTHRTLFGFLILAQRAGSISEWMALSPKERGPPARDAWRIACPVEDYIADDLLAEADLGLLRPPSQRRAASPSRGAQRRAASPSRARPHYTGTDEYQDLARAQHAADARAFRAGYDPMTSTFPRWREGGREDRPRPPPRRHEVSMAVAALRTQDVVEGTCLGVVDGNRAPTLFVDIGVDATCYLAVSPTVLEAVQSAPPDDVFDFPGITINAINVTTPCVWLDYECPPGMVETFVAFDLTDQRCPA